MFMRAIGASNIGAKAAQSAIDSSSATELVVAPLSPPESTPAQLSGDRQQDARDANGALLQDALLVELLAAGSTSSAGRHCGSTGVARQPTRHHLAPAIGPLAAHWLLFPRVARWPSPCICRSYDENRRAGARAALERLLEIDAVQRPAGRNEPDLATARARVESRTAGTTTSYRTA